MAPVTTNHHQSAPVAPVITLNQVQFSSFGLIRLSRCLNRAGSGLVESAHSLTHSLTHFVPADGLESVWASSPLMWVKLRQTPELEQSPGAFRSLGSRLSPLEVVFFVSSCLICTVTGPVSLALTDWFSSALWHQAAHREK